MDKLQSISNFNFASYGLEDLHQKSFREWSENEIEQALAAFASEDIAPIFLGQFFTFQYIDTLLATSHCRCCGRCCLPNCAPQNSSRLLVTKKDLKAIADCTNFSYKALLKKTSVVREDEVSKRRFLPLPCMFLGQKTYMNCEVYLGRPRVCKMYPIILLEGQDGIGISVRCDYGKDIFRNLLSAAREVAQRYA